MSPRSTSSSSGESIKLPRSRTDKRGYAVGSSASQVSGSGMGMDPSKVATESSESVVSSSSKRTAIHSKKEKIPAGPMPAGSSDGPAVQHGSGRHGLEGQTWSLKEPTSSQAQAGDRIKRSGATSGSREQARGGGETILPVQRQSRLEGWQDAKITESGDQVQAQGGLKPQEGVGARALNSEPQERCCAGASISHEQGKGRPLPDMADETTSDSLPGISNVHQYSVGTSNLTNFQSLGLNSTPTRQHMLSGLSDFSTSSWHMPRSVKDFIAALVSLKVEGPLKLTNGLVDKLKLGEGGQFAVYSNELLDESDCSTTTTLEKVAVKKCIKFQDISANERLDLLSPQYRTQVHDMLLEVAALRDTRLHNHRNIVQLIGYGIEMDTWHETPFLVMELAIGDLRHFLSTERTWEVLQQLCLDVGCGLDRVHQCGLVHGDLKPLNVLIFKTSIHVPYVAKLADFGFSVGELDAHHDGLITLQGCSHGWTAPEVEQYIEHGTPVTVAGLMAADRYSYGMLLLSTMCYGGRFVPHDQSKSIKGIETITSAIPTRLRVTVVKAASSLLRFDHALRPQHVGDLLKDSSDTCKSWLQACREFELNKRPTSDAVFQYEWELPSLAPFLVQGLEKSFHSSKGDLTGPQLLAMFLLRSFHDASRADKSVQINMLMEACLKDFPPAQAIAERVLRSYNLPIPSFMATVDTALWMFKAASTGSMFAYHELKQINSSLASQARDQFRSISGYNTLYSPLFGTGPEGSRTLTFGNQAIHQFAAYGNLDALTALLDAEPNMIHSRNDFDETPLYKACMAGQSHVVLELCIRGADASLTATKLQISCLHWMHSFPTSTINDVLSVLVKAGGKLNHTLATTDSLVNYHFPFMWPPGTALHWAVTASHQPLISALLRAGADPSIRNGHDPYKSDENVRQMHSHGNDEVGEFSQTPDDCLGMNAVDLAVAAHDWRSLETISPLISGRRSRFFLEDEEGYTPFHRLSYLRVGRTISGMRFWYPAFKGDAPTRCNDLTRTIAWLQAKGGNIDQLTDAPDHPALSGVDGLSPLMISVTKLDDEAVEALCKAGANVNLQNRSGRTALTLLRDVPVYQAILEVTLLAIVSCLVRYNADVNYCSPDGLTPLQCIAELGEIRSFRLLLEAGANIRGKFKNVNTLAYLIFRNGTYRLIMDRVDQQEIEARDVALSKILRDLSIQQGVWFTNLAVDDTESTLLHCCAAAGLPSCTAALVAAGANLNIPRLKKLSTSGLNQSSLFRHLAPGTPLDVVNHEISKPQWSKNNRLKAEDSIFIQTRMKQVQDILKVERYLKLTRETIMTNTSLQL
ncbi:hypothetical protein EPUS_08947 [Endocarpon pusillum Z07020]|uniref:Protein kinase domain-containing protein n=1 Tax=Endocarpon pusillum (strain Z07020 / HMAS-L-300199) TaxID=1263415 RepID=U1GRC4_ENDPU|nr:uncharacterized protein EPUS_08947 [Endocarpon pusillum Z07020]ERF74536.1 hypothetical protein EPUS_08947 [Endocarpon pusillum Z07020]